MACYSPNNQYYLPRPLTFSPTNFLYGCAYGGVISLLFCNPLPRTIKMTLGWGVAFELAFTRGLYNSPGNLKRTDMFKPDLDRDSFSIYYYIFISLSICLIISQIRNKLHRDWINKRQIEKWFPRTELMDYKP